MSRYWTGPSGRSDPKNCKHWSMTFTVADLSLSILCMDCETQATLHVIDDQITFTTDQAHAALNKVCDEHIPILSAQDWKKMWGDS